jgi:hypothetical protein
MDAVDEFRAQYRVNHIGARYRGRLHFAVTAAGTIAGIAFALSRAHDVTLLELVVVPIAFVFANVVEYLVHRHLMHVPRGPFRFLFARHTLQHHRFFSGARMWAESTRDWKIVLFPPAVIFFFLGLIGAPLAIALDVALPSTNLGPLFGATAAGYFLLYEVCHLAWHQSDDSLIARIPGVRRFREHHRRHHVEATRGFNVTFPIADFLFRT